MAQIETGPTADPADLLRRLATHPGVWAALAAGLALKAALLVTHSVTFNGDEAVLSLMARHILRGEWPVFFWGQSYMGALDAYLRAAFFLVFGETVLAGRLLQTALFAGVVATTYRLADRLSADRFAATAASLLVAVPTVLFSLYTTAGIGNYVEVLLLNNLLWWIGWDGLAGRKQSSGWALLAGLLAGLGWWSMALIAVSVAPLILAFIGLWRKRSTGAGGRPSTSRQPILWQRSAAATLGFLIGSMPWWWAMVNGEASAVVAELAGARVAAVPTNGLGVIGQRVVSLVLFNLPALVGLRPPWSVDWIGLPLGLLVSGVAVIVLWQAARRALSPREPAERRMALLTLIGGWGLVIGAFVFTRFGNDPTGRYLIHLYPPLAILTGDWLGRLKRRALLSHRPALQGSAVAALLAVILGFNLWGNLQAMIHNPPGLTTQFDLISHLPHEYDVPLIDFLDSIGADRGYSNSWVTFRFAFLTHERIVFSPRLPYKADLSYTSLDDRYPPYSEAVAAADRVVYVTSNLPALDEVLRWRFTALGVSYREEHIGPYTVFYDLARPVTLEEIGPFDDQR